MEPVVKQTSKKDNAYYPSLFAVNKYFKYIRYLVEYLRYADIKSVADSFRYTISSKPPVQDRTAHSKLGKFYLRRNTNDFQFINWVYESEIKKFIQKNISDPENTTFLDVGACIGEYNIWLAQRGVRCVAFEPVERNYEAILMNVALNKVEDKVTVLNWGLGRNNEEAFFDIKQVVTSSSHIVRGHGEGASNVTIKRLDDVVNSLKITKQEKVILKLDVEGMEVEVLEGGESFLRLINNIIIIFEKTSVGEDNVVSFLNSIGNFEYKKIDEVNTVAIKQT